LKQDDGARYFGPFPNSSALRSTLALVRRQYHLRGCRPLTPGERDYKHCLYAHLKYCTAPCIGNVTREQYLEQVNAACDFLAGRCEEMQEHLGEEMKRAAASQEYERAADLRDLLSDLRRTTKKVNRFERMPYSLPLALDSDKDLAELAEILGLPAPPQRIEGFDISNISGTFAVASLVSFRNGRPDRANYRRFKIKTVEGQDDFACVAEVVRRRYTRVLEESKVQSPESKVEQEGEAVAKELQQLINDVSAAKRTKRPLLVSSDAAAADARAHRAPGAVSKRGTASLPDLILIDGGKGQLSAACAELEKLGLAHIPILGLAKEFEEIYRPGKREPLRISHESGALKLLQRVRDESHRLANTYNAQLRLRKISESILDEFPNIGERRKAALLKKFGSVQRIRLASVEQIAEVSGFGGKGAVELKAFLEARSNSPRPAANGEPELTTDNPKPVAN
jgi:excinuclease ABC subunit C